MEFELICFLTVLSLSTAQEGTFETADGRQFPQAVYCSFNPTNAICQDEIKLCQSALTNKKGHEHNIMGLRQHNVPQQGYSRNPRSQRSLNAFPDLDLNGGYNETAVRPRRAAEVIICRREPLIFQFAKMSGYQDFITPNGTVDIGVCKGICKAPLVAHNRHAILYYAMRKAGLAKERLCCAPYSYKPLQFWVPGPGGEPVEMIRQDAIIEKCSCQ